MNQGRVPPLLHPLSLAACVLLVVNDHVLRQWVPGWWTGKLSDLAWLLLVPLWVQAGLGFLGGQRGRALSVGLCVAGLSFVSLQLWPTGAGALQWLMGALQWPAFGVLAVLEQQPLPSVRAVAGTADPTDLWLLPTLVLSWNIGRPRGTRAVKTLVGTIEKRP